MATDYSVNDAGRVLIRQLREQVEQRIRKAGLTGAAARNARAKVELTLAAELKRKGTL